MSGSEHAHKKIRNKLTVELERKANRKIMSRHSVPVNVLAGLSTFGLVGWSIGLSTLLGLGIGWWLDQRWPGSISFTLTMLFVGVVTGCVTAWRWVKRESNPSEDI